MKRILCISDSLGLPRPKVPYDETWFSILNKTFPSLDFVSYFRRNGTTDMLSSNGDYGDTLLFYSPQIVILQLGICDCAPRYLRTTSILYRLLAHLPNFLSKPIWALIKRIKHRSLKCTDVPIGRFERNLKEYIQMCINASVDKVILVKIAMPGQAMIKANPLILESIAKYNAVYEKIAELYPDFVTLLNPISIGKDDLFVEDGYHTNGEGHKLIANELTVILRNN